MQNRFPKFEPLRKSHVAQVLDQLTEIVEANRILVKKDGYTLDFTGWSGAVEAFKSIFNKKIDVGLSNFVIIRKGKKMEIVLEDFQLLNLNSGKTLWRTAYVTMTHRVSYRVNAFVVKKVFGFDIG